MSEAMREAFEALLDLKTGAMADYHADQKDIEENYKKIKAALSGAQQGEAPQPAQVPAQVPVAYGLHHVSRLYQVMRTYDSTIDDVALDSMRDTLRAMLTAAPSGDTKREADVLEEFRKRIAGQLTHAGGADARRCLQFTLDKVDWFRKATTKEQAARLRQSGSGDDSEVGE